MINLKIDNYKYLKCGKEKLVVHNAIVVKLRNCQELVVDTVPDPICEKCKTLMFSEELLRVMNKTLV